MIDYILVDSAPVEGGGYKMSARLLWYNEEMEYLPIFQKVFPGFTLDQMDEYTIASINGMTPRKRVLLLRFDMGVKIFRDDNWNRIKSGIISRKDIMRLDAEKDKVLIGYLIAHAPEPCRDSIMKYAAEKYEMDELPQPHQNIDDPNDPYYEKYFVLQEQVIREDDADVLKEAALHSSNYDMASFAFCRLTGYSFPPNECDAYSYRTFDCGILPGMTAEDIREFCRKVIEERGRFANVAEECLRHQKDPNQ